MGTEARSVGRPPPRRHGPEQQLIKADACGPLFSGYYKIAPVSGRVILQTGIVGFRRTFVYEPAEARSLASQLITAVGKVGADRLDILAAAGWPFPDTSMFGNDDDWFACVQAWADSVRWLAPEDVPARGAIGIANAHVIIVYPTPASIPAITFFTAEGAQLVAETLTDLAAEAESMTWLNELMASFGPAGMAMMPTDEQLLEYAREWEWPPPS